MNNKTYLKSKFRWLHDADTWPYTKRIVGCGVNCDADAEGYFIYSDGSKVFTSDENAALILLFSRCLAAKHYKLGLIDRVRCAIAKFLLNF